MLNEKALSILAFIRTSTRERGFPPTIREIGEAFKISSTNGVRYYLELLEKSGHIKRSGKISRALIATGAPATSDDLTGIPILGRVAAGQPIFAEESYEGSLDTTRLFGDPKGLFALRVRGDSMIGAGINQGDYVVVRHQERADAGEIVVGLVGDEATVKYYRPRGQQVELAAANPSYEPIVVDARTEFRILGVVKGVIRTLK